MPAQGEVKGGQGVSDFKGGHGDFKGGLEISREVKRFQGRSREVNFFECNRPESNNRPWITGRKCRLRKESVSWEGVRRASEGKARPRGRSREVRDFKGGHGFQQGRVIKGGQDYSRGSREFQGGQGVFKGGHGEVLEISRQVMGGSRDFKGGQGVSKEVKEDFREVKGFRGGQEFQGRSKDFKGGQARVSKGGQGASKERCKKISRRSEDFREVMGFSRRSRDFKRSRGFQGKVRGQGIFKARSRYFKGVKRSQGSRRSGGFKEGSRDFQGRSSGFQGQVKNFKGGQGRSRDFKGFQEVKGFQGRSRGFKGGQEISREVKGFQGRSRDFKASQDISREVNFFELLNRPESNTEPWITGRKCRLRKNLVSWEGEGE
ncbi:putative maestro heat-like repeat family member 5 [Penaeus vannamei]|uniref:Putative maestro heat-like repeat family member 5 n=1 Tax=Penaeus vannamei TaxID=6689 RepID=A0A3R7PBK4_PENVA|nr:putative maestro heat-like repeat family member 5 [Penaeus vannamei]